MILVEVVEKYVVNMPFKAVDSAGAAPKNVAVLAASNAVSATATAASGAVSAGATYSGNVDLEYNLVVIGGGPGGYTAASRVAYLSANVIVVKIATMPAIGAKKFEAWQAAIRV